MSKALKIMPFLISLLFCMPSFADIYTYTDSQGIIHFTDRLPSKEKRATVNGFRVFEKSGRAKIAFNLSLDELESIIDQASIKHGLEKELVKAVIKAESNFDPKAVSKKGAIGLMQLMPKTAYSMGVDDIKDPYLNVDAGCRFLRRLIDRYEGDIELSLAAYNAGPTAVAKYKGIPPYKETINYVQKVIWYYNYHYKKDDLQANLSGNDLNDT